MRTGDGDIYVQKARAEGRALADRGVTLAGNAFSSVLFAKGEPNAAEREGAALLSGEDGKALRASLAALGYAPEDWAAFGTCDDAGDPLDPDVVRLVVATLDPATVILCDTAATTAFCNAFPDELAAQPTFDEAMLSPGYVVQVLGMRVMSLGGFEAALADARQKQIMWARLKQLPPLGEPY